jgi:hypothetical protein
MGPNTKPSIPVPQTYAETCKLVSSWCEREQSAGGVPAELRRALHFPAVIPGGRCPTTNGQVFSNDQFAGIALGDGPVQPLIGGSPPALAKRGILFFRPSPRRRGWYDSKTLWFARPGYRGPVFIRGRQLDGPHVVVFGEGPSLIDPQMGTGATLNGRGGWRQWPGGTWLRTPGCYAWQIDGSGFSEVIVFEAVFKPAA